MEWMAAHPEQIEKHNNEYLAINGSGIIESNADRKNLLESLDAIGLHVDRDYIIRHISEDKITFLGAAHA